MRHVAHVHHRNFHMRILVFLLGMIAAAVIVGVASALSGAGLGTTILRVIGTLIIAQVLYVIAVFALSRSKAAPDETGSARNASDIKYSTKQSPDSPG